ncbi:hypothetical protein HU200_052324 [Digitaria exilis]|uniref:DUF4220 domain-containing protein n=1 Tax=Digitaria exilis TaxID=1010633 RepID=A0A835E5Z4_9POAL|nr:hypothetical protein HU200_052324 [Digitaria exilis]
MVLVSFSLQLLLLFFGGIRRRRSSALLRVALWSAYLLADSTAIYALGRLSVATGSSRLVAFWAPFLLLHLGGPDNITAYALEDNRLWLRHLQTLAVQVLGAAYVLYRYIHNGLQLASILMLVVGLVKYGERIWALRCGNILLSSSRNSSTGDSDTESAGSGSPHQQVVLRDGIISDDEEILLLAHSQFSVCICVFADTSFVPSSLSKEDVKVLLFHQKTEEDEISGESSDKYKTELLNKMVELELSLMYDVLYTKAHVIHTWYGFCIHLMSMLGTATAFLLFLQFSSSNRSDGSRVVDVNVIISYVLLVGALALEVTSFCRALLSSWTCYALSKWGGGCWVWLVHVLTRLRRHVQPAQRRLWSGSIGQYSLLHLSTRDRNELGNKLAMNKMTGLRDWWSKLHLLGLFLALQLPLTATSQESGAARGVQE